MSITITRGESPTIKLKATTDGSTAFDLTSATFNTKFLKRNLQDELEIGDSAHTITDATNGEYEVDLTAAQTKQLAAGEGLTFVSVVTSSSKDYYFYGEELLIVKTGDLTKQR